MGSFGCQLINSPMAPNPCLNHSNFTNLNAEDLDRTFSGFRSRANLSWKVTEDALLYYTWSQGFRAGGFNRAPIPPIGRFAAVPGHASYQAQALHNGGWVAPLAFAPDTLTNNELGWKTMWMDRRIQWDGAIYQEDWNHAQIAIGANGVISYGILLNGGNYRVRGIETSVVARVTTGLTIEAGAAWNHSELVKQATFLWTDGIPIDFSTLQTRSERRFRIRAGHSAARSQGRPPSRATSAHGMSFRSTAMSRSLRSTRYISHTPSPRPISSGLTCRATPLLMTCPLSLRMMGRSVSGKTRGSCKSTERI